MSIRRLLVATSVAFALLAPVAHAAPGFTLDGRRTTSKQWTATVTQPPVSTGALDIVGYPTLASCTEDTCDVRPLRLSLPRGTTWGRFTATVTVPMQMQTAIALYDAKGVRVQSADFTLGGWETAVDGSYVLSFSLDRLRRGTYTFATHGRVGAGQIGATVHWVALPPDRGSNVHR